VSERTLERTADDALDKAISAVALAERAMARADAACTHLRRSRTMARRAVRVATLSVVANLIQLLTLLAVTIWS